MGRQNRDAIEEQLKTVSNLTPFHRRFLVEYLSQQGNSNATAAYKAAGGKSKHPGKMAWKILQLPHVRAAIDEIMWQGGEMSALENIARLSEQARGIYGRYLRYDPELREVYCDLESLLADGYGHLIKKIDYARTGVESAVQVVEFHDSQSALVHMGKVNGIFKNDVSISTPNGQPLISNHNHFNNLSDDELYESLVNAMAQIAPQADGADGGESVGTGEA